MVPISTTTFRVSRCGCFGPPLSAITLFISDETDRTKKKNELEFDLNGLNSVGLKALLVCLSVVCFRCHQRDVSTFERPSSGQ